MGANFKSDVWLRLNSTLWWIATGFALAATARRFCSVPAAYMAVGFFICNATGVHFAQELRMYAMLMLLSTLSYHLTERCWSDDSRRLSFWLYVVTVAIIYSHGAAFLILLGMWSSAGWVALRRLAPRQRLWRFGFVQGAALLTGLPEQLRAASMHLHFDEGLSYAIAPSLSEFTRQVCWLASGRGTMFGPYTTLTTLVLFLPLLWMAVRTEGAPRRAVLCYFFVPILACSAVSHLSRPIWVFRAISFTLPALCLAMADGTAQGIAWCREQHRSLEVTCRSFAKIRRWPRMAWPCAAFGWSLFGIACQREIYPVPSHFREAAAYVREHGREGDTIYLPQTYGYWAFCWYAIGPSSIAPLTDNGQHQLPTGVTIVKGTPPVHMSQVTAPSATTRYVTTAKGSDSSSTDATLETAKVMNRAFVLMYGVRPAANLLRELKEQTYTHVDHVLDETPVGIWQLHR